MHYDPIKETLGKFFNRWPFTKRLFYHLLDILLLRTWHVHKALRLFFKETGRRNYVQVLDAGSGFGQYAYFLARKKPYWSIKGIDVKAEEVDSCNAFFSQTGIQNASFEVQNLVNYSAHNAYDLILSVDVMEHIREDGQVFSNFFHSLKKDGLLLISTPSNLGGSGVHAEGDSSFIEEHVRDGYSVEEMTEKLKTAGFNKINIQYTYGKPGNISWHLSMKYPILLVGKSRLFFIILPVYYLFVMPFSLILNAADVRFKHKSGTGLLVKAWK
jgi:2-polyprenyl-3-methyl-5-hydroxy-6-metoxy-1,4-benzoquinol methylase